LFFSLQIFDPVDFIVASNEMTEEPTLQTVYEYFSDGGNIVSGLTADDRDWFTLNGKKFRIFSGSLHYFRIHPDHWRDRLRKYRAAGLNAIDV
jgi:beta-galactosidase GanA